MFVYFICSFHLSHRQQHIEQREKKKQEAARETPRAQLKKTEKKRKKKKTILRLIHLQCRNNSQSNRNRKTDTWVSVKREIVLSYLNHYLYANEIFFSSS